jgi:hypothetical protein
MSKTVVERQPYKRKCMKIKELRSFILLDNLMQRGGLA